MGKKLKMALGIGLVLIGLSSCSESPSIGSSKVETENLADDFGKVQENPQVVEEPKAEESKEEVKTDISDIEAVTNSYEGVIDTYPIHMDLSISGEKATGSYYYDKYKEDISFSGNVKDNFIELTTENGAEKFSGVINGDKIFGVWESNGNSLDFSVIDTDNTQMISDAFFEKVGELDLFFTSGVGAWWTDIQIDEKGEFVGNFHDSENGDIGDGYPQGTVYICDFDGKFVVKEKIDEFTYLLTLESLNYEIPENDTEIVEEVRYIYTEPYGLEDEEEFILCLPGKKRAEISEEVLGWDNAYGYGDVEPPEEIEGYILYGVQNERGFY